MITTWHKEAPTAPLYAVSFISQKSDQLKDYSATNEEMMQESAQNSGFLGYSSFAKGREGIFISSWKDHAAIDPWRHHQGHLRAKTQVAKQWYAYYHSMICKVESSKEHGAWLDNRVPLK
jgi:heme-degrading monooxygenase HmoA